MGDSVSGTRACVIARRITGYRRGCDVEQVPFPGPGPGREGLKHILRTIRSAFPDLDFSIKEQIADGDTVASRFEWTHTHEQEFLGYPPRDGASALWCGHRPAGGRWSQGE